MAVPEVVVYTEVNGFFKDLPSHVFLWTCCPNDNSIKTTKESLDLGWALLSEWRLSLEEFVTSCVSI
jgi:hypothetical protein